MSRPLTSPKGRALHVVGNASLLTMDRLEAVRRRFDEDPRIASVSVVASGSRGDDWLRSTAPAGGVVVVALDAGDIGVAAPEADTLPTWARAVSERGLWHDWLLSSAADVARAQAIVETSAIDAAEAESLSSSHADDGSPSTGALSLVVDATWLQEHQTGAQVLTVAAVEALARHPHVASIHLAGIAELPTYARHLAELPSVAVGRPQHRVDIVWYPNQIDGRSDIGAARELGRRVVTTYLDLIAYDIPRYHASDDAWATYRRLQRTIALSVDGVTTISADVAHRLEEEVPRLERDRVRPIPLGIDHLRREVPPVEPPDELRALVQTMGRRPFVLVLGNDFRHKNRDFAIAAWQELLRRGVGCDLVLAGLHVRGSSSKEAEDALLARHVDLRGTAHRLDHVSAESRLWLLANAAAVHYPSSAEGFGFVPYEAASLGTPATFTEFGPLREISRAAGLPSHWEVGQHADDLARMLTDDEARGARITALTAATEAYTWVRFADELVDFFRVVSAMPAVLTSAVAASSADTAKLAAIMSSRSYRAAERLRRLRPRRG